MGKKFKALLLIFFLISNLSYGQKTNYVKAFKGGEKLRYAANYKIGIMNVDVAYIDFTVDEVTRGGVDSYRVNATAQIMPQYSWFFDMKDDYYVWLDKKNLKPLFFENFIREGSYTYQSNYKYDWKNMKVNTYENRPVWDNPRNHEFKIFPNSLDALSLFYNLRTIPISDLKENVMDTLKVVFATKIRTVGYRYVGKETIRIRGLGKVKTLKFICQLADSSGISFEDGSEFTLWLSDDDNRIPLYVETPIKVGSVRARLIEHSGLINTFQK